VVGGDLANEGLTTSIKDAIRLNVAGVGLSVFIGSDYERQTLLSLGKLVDECEEYGIPVMAVTAVGKELEKQEIQVATAPTRKSRRLWHNKKVQVLQDENVVMSSRQHGYHSDALYENAREKERYD